MQINTNTHLIEGPRPETLLLNGSGRLTVETLTESRKQTAEGVGGRKSADVDCVAVVVWIKCLRDQISHEAQLAQKVKGVM